MALIHFDLNMVIPADRERSVQLLTDTNGDRELIPTDYGFEFHDSDGGDPDIHGFVTIQSIGPQTMVNVHHDVSDERETVEKKLEDVAQSFARTTIEWFQQVEQVISMGQETDYGMPAPARLALAAPKGEPFSLHADVTAVIQQPPQTILSMLQVSRGAKIDRKNLTAAVDAREGDTSTEQRIWLHPVRGGTEVKVHMVQTGRAPVGTTLKIDSSTERLRDGIAEYLASLGTMTTVERPAPECPVELAGRSAARTPQRSTGRAAPASAWLGGL